MSIAAQGGAEVSFSPYILCLHPRGLALQRQPAGWASTDFTIAVSLHIPSCPSHSLVSCADKESKGTEGFESLGLPQAHFSFDYPFLCPLKCPLICAHLSRAQGRRTEPDSQGRRVATTGWAVRGGQPPLIWPASSGSPCQRIGRAGRQQLS